MTLKHISGLLLATGLLAGCSVQSEQADMAQAAMQQGDSFDKEDYAWQVRFNDTEARVYAINVGDGIVFADEHGLEIAFDGWDIVMVNGLPGSLGTITVDKNRSPRVHRVQGLDERFEVECADPVQRDYGWFTDCEHRAEDRVYPMDHKVHVADDGRITRIEATLVPGVRPFILTPEFAGEG